ncbi:class I SAM-dependent methyltransferase [Nostoc sp. C117]|uniref:class I SAM-dependent methyltransferase n=1 Tax=Nostoc sp. C117 TaxID=3349875 RepID=UPI00370D2A28
MTSTRVQELGASVQAIEHHYDVGNDFYRLWLDPTMTYTCASWDQTDENDSLEAAQLRKIDLHIHQAKVKGAKRVLDVGCGWGGALKRLVEAHQVECGVGLTLSQSQVDWISQLNEPKIEVLLESWADHSPKEPYDGIISIEAFEAFAKSGLSTQEKIHVYRTFFSKCHQWLKPGGWLSLQTITFGNSLPILDEFISTEIFPESDLPRLAEIAEAVERLFEVVILQNNRADYVQTLKKWRSQLREKRESAIALVGEEQVISFERYLKLSAYMFEVGTCDVYRIAFRRIDVPR